MCADNDDDTVGLTDGYKDMTSTGAAADSASDDPRLKELPRLLRYAALVVLQSSHVEHRLVAEIEELCPELCLNATWAEAYDAGIGVLLARELDHRAVVHDDVKLRGLADCVRLLSLPTPRDSTYFEDHRRVGKALIQSFHNSSRDIEERLRSSLEGFVVAWAALASCTSLVRNDLRAAPNAAALAPHMFACSVDTARRLVWRQVEKREEQRKKEEAENENIKAETSDVALARAAEDADDSSLVVARLSDAEMRNTKIKDILAPFMDVINRAVPLIGVPPLNKVRDILTFEFPYARDVVDLALTDLVGRTNVGLQPLLLVGDPGSGKSRFASRLGEELGVSVWYTDASQCDGAAFAGTARRWYSTEPCHPFLAIARGKIANPLIVIDEIEKAAARADHGRLWDCILAFLETETSARYPDPALQTAINVSGVSYIATANRLDSLPWPVRDRFRVVTFPRPTAKDLDPLLPAILADLAKERGLDRRWLPPLVDIERTAVGALWHGGSVRSLRRIVQAILHQRDAYATRN
jgi:ATP-dependent Lon protease